MVTIEEFDAHVCAFVQSKNLSRTELIANFAMGLAGETGELIDLLKKVLFHGVELNREKLTSELGDVLRYWFALIQQLDNDPIEVAFSHARFEDFHGCVIFSPKEVSKRSSARLKPICC